MAKFSHIVLRAAMTVAASTAVAQEPGDTEVLRQEIDQLRQDYEQRIRALEERLKTAEEAAKTKPVEQPSALDEALAEAEEPEAITVPTPTTDLASGRVGGVNLRLIDVSMDILAAGGSSTVRDAEIDRLQGGNHDPKRRGFTLQQAELAIKGAVDPYLVSEAFVIASDEEVELEEAFFTTTSLPYGLQLEGGFFFTEFGIINPRHPHQWDWLDQPIVNTRLLGGEGQRGTGFRLSKLLPTPWFSELHIGAQNATNETMVSFLGEGHAHGEEEEGSAEHEEEAQGEEGLGGFVRVKDDVRNLGDLTYLARLVNAWELSPTTTAKLGLSSLFGPNTTGEEGESWLYGADLKVAWRPPGFRGWPFLKWQTEAMKRDYKVDKSNPAFVPGETSDDLRDWGLYSELYYGFKPRWAVGVRGEYVTGSGQGPEPRDEDDRRDDRWRISPLLAWYPSEFSRFRLQYNYDNADFLEDDDAHTVWLGAEVLFGKHPAHIF